MTRRILFAALSLVVAIGLPGEARQAARVFTTPEDAARALADAARAPGTDALLAIFGPAGAELLGSSDSATTKRNRETFTVAFAERWRIVDRGTSRKELVVGKEDWPFPVPLVKTAKGWMFDTAAGKEEVLTRRIGRNELATIAVSHAYVKAQRAYASRGHDGHLGGIYARRFASSAGRQDGLYWPVQRGQPRSPLGDLIAEAAGDGEPVGSGQGPSPFHGYLYRIIEAQGAAAPGGARSYVVDGQMTAGFALVAWPAQYDVTGITTFIVNHDGVVYEKDLGPDTATKVAAIRQYNPDVTWTPAQIPSGTP